MRGSKRPAAPFRDRRQCEHERMQHRAFERFAIVEQRQELGGAAPAGSCRSRADRSAAGCAAGSSDFKRRASPPAWPRTSARSASERPIPQRPPGRKRARHRPAVQLQTAVSESPKRPGAPAATRASSAFAVGTTRRLPSLNALHGPRPALRTGRNSPEGQFAVELGPSSARGRNLTGRREDAERDARSKRPPSFGRSAGARLTVIRPGGLSWPPKASAARTRSRLSRTAVSASPTTENCGRPAPQKTSTRTGGASSPNCARVWTVARFTRDGPA